MDSIEKKKKIDERFMNEKDFYKILTPGDGVSSLQVYVVGGGQQLLLFLRAFEDRDIPFRIFDFQTAEEILPNEISVRIKKPNKKEKK